MKKFAIIIVKILMIVSLCLACLIGVAAYVLNNLFSGMCGNEIFSEIRSIIK